MSFDRTGLISACDRHGRIARVVIAKVQGSAPRDVGAAMLVWEDGFSGTIGGGTLEHQAIEAARARLRDDEHAGFTLTQHALGPDLGQCCGGAVVLATECFDAAQARVLPQDVIARGTGDMSLAAARHKAALRAGQIPRSPALIDGWMIEPVSQPTRDLWIWGAGHVGRALVDVMAPLPDFRITWADIDTARFPPDVPEAVTVIAAARPEQLVRYAPARASHLIVTYAHALDLALCHALITHGFGYAGLIGSKTKWARFRSRLAAMGHDGGAIARITCPIGNPALGKAPHNIALGVAVDLIERHHRAAPALEGQG